VSAGTERAHDRPVDIAGEGTLVIRRLRDDPGEYERMVRWRNSPHVREWWDPDDPPSTLAGVTEKYRPTTATDSATTSAVIELAGRPVGFIQFYGWSSYAEEAREIGMPFAEGTWGLDVFIGEQDMVGRGVGSRAVDLLCRHLFTDRAATTVALACSVDNARAIRAYEKAGFEKRGSVLDTDTRGGRRVESWLMVRDRPE
jgi:aminoglycoside 6'-N-acetyltransferase